MLTKEEIKRIIENTEEEIKNVIESGNREGTTGTAHNCGDRAGRAEHGEDYWYTDNAGLISTEIESGSSLDEHRYNNGNYYLSSRERKKEKKRHCYLLDRFSRQNGWTDDIWQEDEADKWYIYFNYNINELSSNAVTCYRDICHFKTYKAAEAAIKKYHDLIIEVMI